MIKPIADRVVIEPIQMESVTKGGIIVPDAAKERPMKGIVIAVGPGKKDDPTVLKEGDVVLYGKFSGIEIEEGGKEFLMMREIDVFCTV